MSLATLAISDRSQFGPRQPIRTAKGDHLMKVMAIASITKPLSPEQRQQIMPNEVPATLKLYLDGKIEQFWYRQDAPGVIFLMNVESVEQAKAAVEALPLAAGGFADYQLMQVGPLAPLGMLIQGK
jgi:hypothetical protein